MLPGRALSWQHHRGCTLQVSSLPSFRSLLLPRSSSGGRQTHSAGFQVLAAAFRPCIDIHQVSLMGSIFSMPMAPVQMMPSRILAMPEQ